MLVLGHPTAKAATTESLSDSLGHGSVTNTVEVHLLSGDFFAGNAECMVFDDGCSELTTSGFFTSCLSCRICILPTCCFDEIFNSRYEICCLFHSTTRFNQPAEGHTMLNTDRRVLPVTSAAGLLAALSMPAYATFTSIPEPSTMLLLAGGVGAALLIGRARGRK